MITIFNCKELILTMDIKRRADICEILSVNKIDYKIKVTNLQNGSLFENKRGRFGSFGINGNSSYEYKIYVHKKDYNYALKLIR